MSDEEARWLSAFDRSYNAVRFNKRAFRDDTMKGRWVGDESIMDIIMTVNNNGTEETGRLTDARDSAKKPNGYSARDYWALPAPWYSDGWVNTLIRVMDQGKEPCTEIPGIVKKENFYVVSSFHGGKNVRIGSYLGLEEAKEALREYNRTVTKRGWGVDFE
jgi:hypothetical protein